MADSVTVPLKKPVKAHGKEVESLTLREPGGEDIMVCGYPLTHGGVDAMAVGKYIARLADIPPSSVKALGVADFNACADAVIGFFLNAGEQPTPG